jgi:hypothetical protein
MVKLLFKEEQRFNRPVFLVVVSVAFGVPSFFVTQELISSIEQNSNEILSLGLVLAVLLFAGVALIFLFTKNRMLTEITPSYVQFKFPPFVRKWKRFEKTEIEKFEVRKYKPIREYGGWGVRPKWKKKDMAYSISGNIGLQLYLKNGKTILIGTHRKQAIESAMIKFLGPGFQHSPDEKTGSPTPGARIRGRMKKFLMIIAIELVLAVVIFILIQIFK